MSGHPNDERFDCGLFALCLASVAGIFSVAALVLAIVAIAGGR